jgi:hypothetical protein
LKEGRKEGREVKDGRDKERSRKERRKEGIPSPLP